MLCMPCMLQALEGVPETQDAVAKLCCVWWQSGAAGKENLAAQALPYMLVGRQIGSVWGGQCSKAGGVLGCYGWVFSHELRRANLC